MYTSAILQLIVSQNMPGSSKLAQLFVRRQLKVFACIELLYGSVNQIFFPRIYSSPPVINMMYILKYMYVSTFEEKT